MINSINSTRVSAKNLAAADDSIKNDGVSKNKAGSPPYALNEKSLGGVATDYANSDIAATSETTETHASQAAANLGIGNLVNDLMDKLTDLFMNMLDNEIPGETVDQMVAGIGDPDQDDL